MNYKIVSDSSSNVLSMGTPRFASVPMKVRAEKEYIDDANLDLAQMVEDLKNHKGTSGSSCPNVGEWLEAFGDADMIFGVTISKTSPAATMPPSRPLKNTWSKTPASGSTSSTLWQLALSRPCSSIRSIS